VDVFVASDGYPGMLYKVEGIKIPDVPKVTDDGGKKDKGEISEHKPLEHSIEHFR
jgi:antiviral helicase SLH1